MKTDRRVQRTQERLQKAMFELISDRNYESITIQEIVDRANVGRTTFYLHYGHKDDLFLSCHEAILDSFQFLYSLTSEELSSPSAPPGMTAGFQHLQEARAMLSPIFQGQNGTLPILRRIRDRSAEQIEASLRAAFAEADSAIPFDVLANYLAGAQIALVQWWLEKRRSHTPENLAQTYHRLQRAAIRDAFGLKDNRSA